MGSNEGDTYVITGIQASVTKITVPLRLEADKWYPGQTEEHIIQNSLFIWALKALQARHPTRKLSFFQIAGIHGYPYQSWDEEDYTAATGSQGYCTHNSLLFPCWHRPYMALYEQVLYKIMVSEIIPDVPESVRDEWKSAADTWRLPYWDWAEKKSRKHPEGMAQKLVYDVPLIAKEPRIEVLDYRQADIKTLATVDNPMFKFTMPANVQMGSFGINDIQEKYENNRYYTLPYSKSRSTSRWASFEPQGGAVSEAWVDGTVNNDRIAEALEAHDWNRPEAKDGLPLADMVYRLFDPQYIKSFAQFATTRKPVNDPRRLAETLDPAGYLNLEFIHNNIHIWTGGLDRAMGHMNEVPVAGFDPIFYMHHCNIDRQFAIWQALNEHNPDNWFDDLERPYDDDGTWSIVKGDRVSPKTPLAPFHKNDQARCFDSDDIRKWMSLGYTYPELQPWLDKYKTGGKFDEDKYVDDIKQQLAKLYKPVPAGLTEESMNADIIVNVTYDRYAFNGMPYTIYLFVGDKSAPHSYAGPTHRHPQLVGFVYTFSNPVFGAAVPGGRGCKNCQKDAEEKGGALSSAQIPLTAALLARQKATAADSEPEVAASSSGPEALGIHPLDGLGKKEVGDYLEKYLYWSVKSGSGMDIEVSDEQSSFLEITVHHRAAPFDDHESGAAYIALERATRAKPGGYMYKGAASGATETLPTR